MERNQGALQERSVTPKRRLLVSLELADSKWRVWATDSAGTRVSEYRMSAGDGPGLLAVIERARVRFGLGKDVPVLSCYEAGRDGFWLHRFLEANGIGNLVVDASSIEVNRRQRRAKTDRIDGRKLLANLVRFTAGEKKVWSVLHVPSAAAEDARRPHRERERLVKERRAHVARMKSLLVMHNVRLERVGGRRWDQRLQRLELPRHLRAELEREAERLALVDQQIAHLERDQAGVLKSSNEQALAKQRHLQQLRAVGRIGAWTLVCELFGWRVFNNRRQVAASVGLCGSPYNSGTMERDQGISKAGNPRIRTLMVELAWAWLRFQPESALAKWYMKRFGCGKGRARRIGIVALARRLLIALWRFVEHGVLPQGAKLKAA
jgi:transposase